METQHTEEASQLQRQVQRREGPVQLHHHGDLTRGLPRYGSQQTEKQNQLQDGKTEHNFTTLTDRPDILNAKQANELACNVAYSSKTKHYSYNDVLGRSDIEHANVASKLTSQVKSKTNQNQVIEGSMDLPILLHLEYMLHATKLQSNVKYKKKYERCNGHYYIALDTTEQQENAVLHSQKEYRKEYDDHIWGKALVDIDLT
ncbi:nebulette-like [Salvelinus fontinalis]|uniref:nebulette-like n=1 Tax=Salvelinus fontinalis TaxID=8038 RepID=UPI002485CF3C|nr:nebulette-like [Salvelinus fontinalis]